MTITAAKNSYASDGTVKIEQMALEKPGFAMNV
jgi:hypothetical protein